ncbi:beta strand repeat-containing protein [Halomonas sp. WWR20]
MLLKADARTLTEDTDVLNGTAGDDTFLAPDGALNTFDQIDGGAGRDTLRTEAAGDFTGDISSVEVVRVEGDTAATVDFNASNVDGLEQVWFVGNETGANVTNLSASQTVGLQNSTGEYGVETQAGVTTANIAVNNSQGQSAIVNLDTAGTGTVSTLNVASQGTDTLVIGTGNSDLRTVNVNAATRLTLSQEGAFTLGTGGQSFVFSAAGSNGDIIVGDDNLLENATSVTGGAGDDQLGNLRYVTDIDTGAGDDQFDLSDRLADEAVTANAGAGDDVVNVGGTDNLTLSDSVDGGEGFDTVQLVGTDFTDLGQEQLDIINGFANFEALQLVGTEAVADDPATDGVDESAPASLAINVDASDFDYSNLQFGSQLEAAGAGALDASVTNLSAEQTVTAQQAGALAIDAASETVNVATDFGTDQEGEVLDTNALVLTATVDAANAVADADEVDGGTLNLSGNGAVTFNNSTGRAFETVDASALEGDLTYTNVSDVEETVALGSGSDTLNVVNGSTYGSMDVIQNFDSVQANDEDAVDTITGIFNDGAGLDQVNTADATSLNAAFSSAAQASNGAADYVFFQFEENTYVYASADDQYDAGDFALQINGVHDLSAENEVYAA